MLPVPALHLMPEQLAVVVLGSAWRINPRWALCEGKVGPACHDETGEVHNATRRNRSALVMTETDDKLIAAAAIIGDSNIPVTG